MRSLAFLACLAGMAAPHARAALLFNNGDTDDYMNFLDCSTCRGAGGVKVYDDFTVPASGWTITGISGNYFFQSTTPTLPTLGTWEIRSGMSQGVLGTLLATGTTALVDTPISNPSNCTGCTVVSYHIAVTISPINLSPGTYWVTLAPDSPSPNEDFLWATFGANGTNAKIDGLAFATGPFFPGGPQDLAAYEHQFQSQITAVDFSMQLTGVAGVPEPATIGAVLLGLGLCAVRLRSLKKRVTH